MEDWKNSMTGKQWAELLTQKPELASPDVPWERLGILDWALLLKTQPQLEKFRPQLPPGCPYELLSIAEIMDLRREVEEDMKKYRELMKKKPTGHQMRRDN